MSCPLHQNTTSASTSAPRIPRSRPIGPDGTVKLAHFPFLGQLTDAYRSLLYFEQHAGKAGAPPSTFCWTGPAGIEHYLNADSQGRLIQSLKSFLAIRNMDGTQVFERKRTIEELISRILSDVRAEASRQFGVDIRHATAGRPVKFVGADNVADDNYAEDRLADAFSLAGFDTIAFELEPVAAAYQYESTLDHDELILIGDFGGGTSDFSLVRVGPSIRERGREDGDLLGNAASAWPATPSTRRSSAGSSRPRLVQRAGTSRWTRSCRCRRGRTRASSAGTISRFSRRTRSSSSSRASRRRRSSRG
jgi:hypothetical protein